MAKHLARLSFVGLAMALLACGCAEGPASKPAPVVEEAWFIDVARSAGLTFTHTNGASGRLYYPEILPPGVALFDFDGDDDLDVYVVQGHALSDNAARQGAPAPGRLFRNDLAIGADGNRRLRFVDVTAQSGLVTTGYGTGVTAGDIDNDGRVDLFVTQFGGCQLFRNLGNGRFSDVTEASGTANPGGYAVSAALVDVDRDGWLDLYVGNNVRYRLDNQTVCPNPAGVPDYCPPQIYGGLPDRLYRNLGGGKFSDVTASHLTRARFGPALGVSTADFTGDGWPDIFVANDGEDNLLWVNQGDGRFAERALASGVAVTAEGKAEASMGVDAGDFDNDGDEDLVVTELTGQGSNLFVNDGRGRFTDASAASAIGPLSLPYTGWGTAWFDYDNDTWLDVLAVNGTIIANEAGAGRAFPYDQRMLLLRNLGGGHFESVGSKAGPVFTLSDSGRGAAFGDIDNDGDVDVVVGNDNGPLRVLSNQVGSRAHWLGLRLRGVGGRDMLGARAAVVRAEQPPLWRRARADGSYASANDPRVLVGLGEWSRPVSITVVWPDGREESWSNVAIDRWLTLEQGSGR